MNLLSKLFGKGEQAAEKAPSIEEFVLLIRVYFQGTMAVNLGITNLNFVPDLALFKRMLKIATQGNKLGLAEKSRARKVLMQDYGLPEKFFRELDGSIKKNCRTQNDIQSYYIVFQGFCTDLFTLVGDLGRWKMLVPRYWKGVLRSLTQKMVHDILVKTDWKEDSVRKKTADVRKYRQMLGLSEAWISEFVFQIVLLAKKQKKNSVEEDEKEK